MLIAGTGIREFEEEDLPGVAELHRRVMTPNAAADVAWLPTYRKYFRDVFLSDAALRAASDRIKRNAYGQHRCLMDGISIIFANNT